MRKIAIGTLVLLLALAISSTTVFGFGQPFNGGNESQQQGNAKALAQEKDKPYIGIVVSTVGEARAKELGIPGGAVVRSVLADSPSAGVLKAGDIILSINGQQIKGAQTVIEIVRGAKVGDVLNMDVRRGDATIKVQVKVGSRPAPAGQPQPGAKGITPGIAPLLKMIPGVFLQRVLNAQIVVQTDEGVKTIKVLAGTIASVDTTAKSITVKPKDGSTNVTFVLTSGTSVLINRSQGDLSGVKTGDEVRVISVDNEVKLVLVGTLSMGPGMAPFKPMQRGGRGMPGKMGKGAQASNIAIPEPEQNRNGWLTL